jgi:DNA-binding CsgD family transcriptional regulator
MITAETVNGIAGFQAIGTLTAQQRSIVVLRYFDDRSEKEVADLLGVSAGTVKSTASRAVAQLRVSPQIATLFTSTTARCKSPPPAHQRLRALEGQPCPVPTRTSPLPPLPSSTAGPGKAGPTAIPTGTAALRTYLIKQAE